MLVILGAIVLAIGIGVIFVNSNKNQTPKYYDNSWSYHGHGLSKKPNNYPICPSVRTINP